MSWSGSLSDKDSKKIALDLFEEQRSKIKECVANLEKIFETFYNNEDCDEVINMVFKSESEADQIKDKLLETLFKGTFLPFTGEDRLRLVEMNDNVADATEKVAQFLKVYLPILKKEMGQDLKKEMWQLTRKLIELTEHLAKSLELLADDFKGAFEEADIVEKIREEIRHEGFQIVERLFKEENSDVSVNLLIKEIVLCIVNVADVAEETSDFITTIVVKYAY